MVAKACSLNGKIQTENFGFPYSNNRASDATPDGLLQDGRDIETATGCRARQARDQSAKKMAADPAPARR